MPQVVVGGGGAAGEGSQAAVTEDGRGADMAVLVEYVYCDDYFERAASKGAASAPTPEPER